MVLFANIKSTSEELNQANRLSYCLKIAETSIGNIMMAVISEALTEQQKGAIASAFLVEQFNHWFTKNLAKLSRITDYQWIQAQWLALLDRINQKLLFYGHDAQSPLATSISLLLIFESRIAIQLTVGSKSNIRITGQSCQTFIGTKKSVGGMKKDCFSAQKQNGIEKKIGIGESFEVSFGSWDINEPTMFMISSNNVYPKVSNQEMVMLFNPTMIKNRGAINKSLDSLFLLAQKHAANPELVAIAVLC